MKVFLNKNIWKKIAIVLLFLLLFQFVICKPSNAEQSSLLEPVTGLFANLGDGIMELLQKTFINAESSGAWVEKDNSLWAKIITIAAAVLICVTIIVASVLSAGVATFAVIASAAGAIIKVAGVGLIAYFAVAELHFGSEGFYLPAYELSLQAIFSDNILAFDVDFFNPKENILNKQKKIKATEKNVDIVIDNKTVATKDDEIFEFTILGMWEKFEKEYDFNIVEAKKEKNTMGLGVSQSYGGNTGPVLQEYSWTNKNNGKKYKAFIGQRTLSGGYGGATIDVQIIAKLREVTDEKIEKYTETEKSLAGELQPTISSWYKTLRNLAVVALLSILVYVGIRITLTSIASDKAKYKQMLMDWVVAFCLVFLMHYIMSFAVTINKKILEAISSVTVSTYGTVQDIVGDNATQSLTGNGKAKSFDTLDSQIDGTGNQLFIIGKDDAKLAYKVLIDEKNPESSSFYKWFVFSDPNNPKENNVQELKWPVNDFMAQARLLGQDIGENETQTAVIRAGYNVIYVVLVVYTVIFCFTYLRRVVYMAFLTLMAPLVAITYPIDKMGDGKAQAFDMWLKEYIFNLLIQPMHLILYVILVGSAMQLAVNNIFYAVIAIGFLVPAEKILRRFFGFEKAQTPGMFAGATGTALMMQGLNKLLRKPLKGGRNGNSSKNSDDEEQSKISTYKKRRRSYGFIVRRWKRRNR